MAADYSTARRRAVIVFVAALAGVLLTGRLGVWQLDRAAQKQALQTSLETRATLPELPADTLARTAAEAEPQHHRRIRVAGEWVASGTVFLENRQMHGQPGFFVVTPLRLAGRDEAVLVQRGWAPRDLLDRQKVPDVPTPSGPVEVLAQVAPPPGRLYDFAGGAASGPLRQNVDIDAKSVELRTPLRPLSLVQLDESPAARGDGLRRDWPAPAVDIQKHHGYAFQWFALCALIAGLYVWFQLVRPRLARRAA